MTRIFHWFFMWKMDPMSGFDILLVFTLPPRDSTLQYKRCVHLWNNFPCIITLKMTKLSVQNFWGGRICRAHLLEYPPPPLPYEKNIIIKENRIYTRGEFRESLGMNFFSPFQPQKEFKVYKSCKCSQIVCSREHYIYYVP